MTSYRNTKETQDVSEQVIEVRSLLTSEEEIISDEEWAESVLKFFVEDLLALVIQEKEIAKKFLTPENATIILTSFISSTAGSNNYQKMEFIGDKLLSPIIASYIKDKYPKLTNAEMSNIVTHYASDEFFAEISQALGLANYAKTAPGLNKNYEAFGIHADLFESLMYTIYETGKNVFSNGGFDFALLFFEAIVNNYDVFKIDTSFADGNPKTIVSQMNEKISGSLKNPFQTINSPVGGIVTSYIQIPESFFGKLIEAGISEKNVKKIEEKKNTYRASANNLNKSERLAYEMLYNDLKKIGVTKDWAERVKNEKDYQDETVAKYVPNALKRLKKDGYDYFKFPIDRKMAASIYGDKRRFMILEGWSNNPNKDYVVLATMESDTVSLQQKAALLMVYSNGCPHGSVFTTIKKT